METRVAISHSVNPMQKCRADPLDKLRAKVRRYVEQFEG